MRVVGALPFYGQAVRLAREQGGRESGPPPTPADQDHAATGLVLPATVATGLASLVLRVADCTAWRPAADAGWLAADNVPPHLVIDGDILAVTEGHRVVAYFHVESTNPVVA